LPIEAPSPQKQQMADEGSSTLLSLVSLFFGQYITVENQLRRLDERFELIVDEGRIRRIFRMEEVQNTRDVPRAKGRHVIFVIDLNSSPRCVLLLREKHPTVTQENNM